ncbi:phage holin family protein [Mesonia maritima]|uniref:Oligopeptide transporter (OPT) family protein n=1 Tax=Mesonia maritima TaxID=1793873 RepID=A0ABU1K2G3_9FLAO|nr:phage holin family protein [Mesonia maritima]MDR6299791.1 putative oligopeptide transporter (OPT) family protein [Mesonia maritima]
MAFTKLTDHIDGLSNDIQAYLESMLEYYKLDAFKKITKVTSLLVKLLVIGSIFLFFLGFISVGLAILIGNAIGSLSSGFFIVGGIYLIAFILFMVFGKPLIDKFILQKFSRLYFNSNDLEDVLDEPLEDETA